MTLQPVPGKVFAHVLLDRIKTLIHAKRRHEQGGFTPDISTVDSFLILGILAVAQTRREYYQPLCGLP